MFDYSSPNSPIIGHKSRSLFPKPTLITIVLLALAAITLGIIKYTYKPPAIDSYDKCAALDTSTIQETFPAVCITTEGQKFTQPVANPPTPAVSPTPYPTPTPIPPLINPQTGWHIHRLPTYKLEIPADWTVQIANQQVKFMGKGFKSTRDGQYNLEISTITSTVSASQYAQDQRDLITQQYPDQITWKTSTTTLAGEPAIKVQSDMPGFAIYVKHPDQNQILELLFLDDFAQDPALTTQILSTFKFVGATCPKICAPPTCSPAPNFQLNSCSCPIYESCAAPPSPTTTSELKPCIRTGCSGQICADTTANTTCEELPEYTCYKTAVCTRQPNGQCGWTLDTTLTQCLETARRQTADNPEL